MRCVISSTRAVAARPRTRRSISSLAVTRIEVGGRLVEHEHRRVGEQRPRERRCAGAGRRRARAPPRRRACRGRPGDRRPSPRSARGGAPSCDLGVARGRAREAHVVSDRWPRTGASPGRRPRSRGRTSSWRYSRRSRPASRHPPALRIEEPEQQVGDRRLAGAARPEQRDALAGLEPEADSVDRGTRLARGSARATSSSATANGHSGPGAGPIGSRTAARRSVSSRTPPARGERRRQLAGGRAERRDGLK